MGASVVAFIVGIVVVGTNDCGTGDVVGDMVGVCFVAFNVGCDVVGAPVVAFIVGIVVVGTNDCGTGDVVGDIVEVCFVAFNVGCEVVDIGVVVGDDDCATGDAVGDVMVGARLVPLDVGKGVVELEGALGAIVTIDGEGGVVVGESVGIREELWYNVGKGVVELLEAVGATDSDKDGVGFVVSGTDSVTSLIVCSVLVHN